MSQFWRREVQDQGVGRVGSLGGLASWPADGHLLAVSSRGLSSLQASPVSPCVSRCPLLRRTPVRLGSGSALMDLRNAITPQRPRLQRRVHSEVLGAGAQPLASVGHDSAQSSARLVQAPHKGRLRHREVSFAAARPARAGARAGAGPARPLPSRPAGPAGPRPSFLPSRTPHALLSRDFPWREVWASRFAKAVNLLSHKPLLGVSQMR